MKNTTSLDPIDKQIIHYLYNYDKATTNQIAEGINISWKTALIHTAKLAHFKFLKRITENKQSYWVLEK